MRAIEGTGARILDTRKTTPGLRALEKYAVLVGGGKSHRKDLGEAVLIKENHIRLAGGVRPALAAAEAARGRAAWIEIEVTNLEELSEALAHAPDVILLDNMSPPTGGAMRRASPRARSKEKNPNRSLRRDHAGERAGIRRGRRGLDFRGRADAFRSGGGFKL